jgi:hypothetical protein
MKAKLPIYQKGNNRNQVEQWEQCREQIGEIIQDAFESYQKDKELYLLHIETY